MCPEHHPGAEGLLKAQEAAFRASKVFQEVAEMQARQLAGTLPEEELVPRTGLANGGVTLAIMDAIEHPLPSSGGSGEETAEPKKKRRGREVLDVGGSTADDVHMRKEEGGSGDGGVSGSESIGTVPEDEH